VCLPALALAHCSVGPDYSVPSTEVPPKYKELKGWKPAQPNDAADRGEWWLVFKDPRLDRLERQIDISNQTLKASEAAYRQSLALIREARAGLFPTISADYNATRQHEGSGFARNRSVTANTFNPEVTASWDLDLWGRIRRTVESDAAAAQASAADLANARLSAQAQLATAYFNLQAADSLKALLDKTAGEYQRTLTITQNQYSAGTAAKADVITAQSLLLSVQAQAINVGVQRAQYEHAIAVLIGKPPAELTITTSRLGSGTPKVPATLPSSLLERRPDIAAAERQVQQQNALIGAATAAYYPSLTLSATAGFSGTRPLPFTAANEIWSLGAAAAQPVFNGGLTAAQVDAARATYDQSVATYRQTVLAGFQQVEDQLSTLRILMKQSGVQDKAVDAARQAVEIDLNQYKAGTIPFTTVVTAEANYIANEQAALTIRQNQALATVALIEALGGGWKVSSLRSIEDLETGAPEAPAEVAAP
jgi:NodT family efflux transporter outer membrane factor (OMF) lipoprotein